MGEQTDIISQIQGETIKYNEVVTLLKTKFTSIEARLAEISRAVREHSSYDAAADADVIQANYIQEAEELLAEIAEFKTILEKISEVIGRNSSLLYSLSREPNFSYSQQKIILERKVSDAHAYLIKKLTLAKEKAQQGPANVDTMPVLGETQQTPPGNTATEEPPLAPMDVETATSVPIQAEAEIESQPDKSALIDAARKQITETKTLIGSILLAVRSIDQLDTLQQWQSEISSTTVELQNTETQLTAALFTFSQENTTLSETEYQQRISPLMQVLSEVQSLISSIGGLEDIVNNRFNRLQNNEQSAAIQPQAEAPAQTETEEQQVAEQATEPEPVAEQRPVTTSPQEEAQPAAQLDAQSILKLRSENERIHGLLENPPDTEASTDTIVSFLDTLAQIPLSDFTPAELLQATLLEIQYFKILDTHCQEVAKNLYADFTQPDRLATAQKLRDELATLTERYSPSYCSDVAHQLSSEPARILVAAINSKTVSFTDRFPKPFGQLVLSENLSFRSPNLVFYVRKIVEHHSTSLHEQCGVAETLAYAARQTELAMQLYRADNSTFATVYDELFGAAAYAARLRQIGVKTPEGEGDFTTTELTRLTEEDRQFIRDHRWSLAVLLGMDGNYFDNVFKKVGSDFVIPEKIVQMTTLLAMLRGRRLQAA